MRFTAEHISHSKVEDGWVLALADSLDGTGPTHLLLSYGEEGDQDRALGLTGLFVSSTWSSVRGYGFIERVAFQDGVVSVIGRNGQEDAEIVIATDMMPVNEIEAAVARCNHANQTRPEKKA